MYESVRKNTTDPKQVPMLNRIAQSLEQSRVDLAIMRAKLELKSDTRARHERLDEPPISET
jgi:hypothetical protein